MCGVYHFTNGRVYYQSVLRHDGIRYKVVDLPDAPSFAGKQ
jgi:hypothetical protein